MTLGRAELQTLRAMADIGLGVDVGTRPCVFGRIETEDAEAVVVERCDALETFVIREVDIHRTCGLDFDRSAPITVTAIATIGANIYLVVGARSEIRDSESFGVDVDNAGCIGIETYATNGILPTRIGSSVGESETRRSVVSHIESQRIRAHTCYDWFDREIVDDKIWVGLARGFAFDANIDSFAYEWSEVVGERECAIDNEFLISYDAIETCTTIVGHKNAHVASVESKDVERHSGFGNTYEIDFGRNKHWGRCSRMRFGLFVVVLVIAISTIFVHPIVGLSIRICKTLSPTFWGIETIEIVVVWQWIGIAQCGDRTGRRPPALVGSRTYGANLEIVGRGWIERRDDGRIGVDKSVDGQLVFVVTTHLPLLCIAIFVPRDFTTIFGDIGHNYLGRW